MKLPWYRQWCPYDYHDMGWWSRQRQRVDAALKELETAGFGRPLVQRGDRIEQHWWSIHIQYLHMYIYIYTYYMVNCWLWIGIAKLLQVVRWLGHFSVAIFRPYLKSWRPDFIQNCWWLTSAAAFWLSHGFVIEIHQIWGRRKLST